nr:hypothetical protein [uncultured Mediterranean phage uvMED]BAR29889.1 hypothetical protein [uncultured Mediterranean phage uvMED]BAR29918.1 hypothetical protein [uncultured Mediterranean phage uvMED]
MTALNLWTHPKTGQQRIYCNLGQVAKVWVEQTDPDPLGQDYTINTSSRDLAEFSNSQSLPKTNIADNKYAIFTHALGLAENATGKEVLDVAPNFASLVELCGDD